LLFSQPLVRSGFVAHGALPAQKGDQVIESVAMHAARLLILVVVGGHAEMIGAAL
jgi:hypothetical protein